jgi:hypothetical protein
MTYFITYLPTGPAYPCHAEQVTEWITPTGMTEQQAKDAFRKQFPSAEIIHCQPKQ